MENNPDRTKKHILIFLDIDGVLLPFGSGHNGRDAHTTSRDEEDSEPLFPDGCLEAFALILQECSLYNLYYSNDDEELEDEKKGECYNDSNHENHNNIVVGIVLSSTWRVHKKYQEQILQAFRAYGQEYNIPMLAKMEAFFSTTDPSMHTERQWEIYEWLKRNSSSKPQGNRRHGAVSKSQQHVNIVAWVALDDEELLEGAANLQHHDLFRNHVVRTGSSVGLTQQDAKKAIRLIRAQCEISLWKQR